MWCLADIRNLCIGLDFLAGFCIRAELGLDVVIKIRKKRQFMGLQEGNEALEKGVVGHKVSQ